MSPVQNYFRNCSRIFTYAVLFVAISSNLLYSQGTISFTKPSKGDQYVITQGNTTSIEIEYEINLGVGYTFSSVDLNTENGSYSVSNGTTISGIAAGNKYWTLVFLYKDPRGNLLRTSSSVNFNVAITNSYVTVDNSFGEQPYDGTLMGIDGTETFLDPSGTTLVWASNSFPHTLTAINQIVEFPSGFYNTKLNYWDNGSQSNLLPINYPPASNYTATFSRLCNLHFANYINGANRGSININGTVYNAPSPQLDVWTPSTVTATAINQDYNWVHYTFSRWEDNSTNATRIITASRHNTYTAYFTGTPQFPDEDVRHLSVSQSLYQPLRLTWSEHPNSDVNYYKIYRKVKNTTSWVNPVCIGTVPRGTTYFDDFDYMYTTNFNTIILYDVKAYCSVWGTMSSDWFQGPYYGELVKSTADSSLARNQEFNNSMANYPNPFNPVTQIRYSIKENAFVSLQVYDILGNIVADLVNEYKPSGSYNISFNASSLPSGIYISRIKAGSYLETKKMLLVK